jgi:hypothetical protein
MAKLGEVVSLPCQFCGRMEGREAISACRVATCFECKAERRREVARKQQRAKRAGTGATQASTPAPFP